MGSETGKNKRATDPGTIPAGTDLDTGGPEWLSPLHSPSFEAELGIETQNGREITRGSKPYYLGVSSLASAVFATELSSPRT